MARCASSNGHDVLLWQVYVSAATWLKDSLYMPSDGHDVLLWQVYVSAATWLKDLLNAFESSSDADSATAMGKGDW